jgi:hypothetical protein
MQIQQESEFPASFPEPENIIIDCDAGGDDAQAVILCFHLAKKYNKRIVGIFCCEGNTSIENVVKNVLVCKGVLIEHDEELKKNFPIIVRGTFFMMFKVLLPRCLVKRFTNSGTTFFTKTDFVVINKNTTKQSNTFSLAIKNTKKL